MKTARSRHKTLAVKYFAANVEHKYHFSALRGTVIGMYMEDSPLS